MKQVPTNFEYLIVGHGRLAKHLHFYLNHIGCSTTNWNRQSHSQDTLKKRLSSCTYALLCIHDDSLEGFARSLPQFKEKLIHFSGAKSFKGVKGFHPLMTFAKPLLSIETYKSIHFIGSEKREEFLKVFPLFTNSYFQISDQNKALYHSLCVLSGNGTTLLWELVFKAFSEIGLPQDVCLPYLQQVTKNILEDKEDRFTGPWYRKDKATINKHKEALQGSTLESLYQQMNQLSQQLEASR